MQVSTKGIPGIQTSPLLDQFVQKTEIYFWFNLSLQVLRSLMPNLRRRSNFILFEWEQIALASLPIAMFTGVGLGFVTWIQTNEILSKFGADSNLPPLVTISVVVLSGPLLCGLIMAARIAAGTTARLSAMKISDEIDAIESLGVNVVELLVTPRVIASSIALPILTGVVILSSIAGGWLMQWLTNGTSPLIYWERSIELLTIAQVLVALGKTTVFGGLSSFISAGIGIRVPTDTESLGTATVQSVVICLLAIIFADVLLTAGIHHMLQSLTEK